MYPIPVQCMQRPQRSRIWLPETGGQLLATVAHSKRFARTILPVPRHGGVRAACGCAASRRAAAPLAAVVRCVRPARVLVCPPLCAPLVAPWARRRCASAPRWGQRVSTTAPCVRWCGPHGWPCAVEGAVTQRPVGLSAAWLSRPHLQFRPHICGSRPGATTMRTATRRPARRRRHRVAGRRVGGGCFPRQGETASPASCPAAACPATRSTPARRHRRGVALTVRAALGACAVARAACFKTGAVPSQLRSPTPRPDAPPPLLRLQTTPDSWRHTAAC